MNLTPYGEFVQSRAKKLDSLTLDLLHAAVGMSGEAAEMLDADLLIGEGSVREELGDFGFYWEWGRQVLSLMWVGEEQRLYDDLAYVDPHESHPGMPIHVVGADLAVMSGKFLDLAKKLWIYNKPFEELKMKLGKTLWSCYQSQVAACAALGWTINDIQHENREKLLARYPTGYTDQAAQARADKPAEVQS